MSDNVVLSKHFDSLASAIQAYIIAGYAPINGVPVDFDSSPFVKNITGSNGVLTLTRGDDSTETVSCGIDFVSDADVDDMLANVFGFNDEEGT